MISDETETNSTKKTRIWWQKTHLVRRRDQSANQAGDDHDFIEEDEGDDVGQRKTGGEDEFQQESRGGDNPIDVSDIPNGARESLLVSVEFDENGSATEVGRHTVAIVNTARWKTLQNSPEVGNRCGRQNQDCQVVECPPSFRQREHPCHEAQIGKEHDGEDRPQPVRALGVDRDIRVGRVGFESVVTHCEDCGWRVKLA
jgi:hypothetical protein